MEIALMVEGQNGLNWASWQGISALAEEKGFAGLYRSDHFTNSNPPDRESLECWTSITWLASNSTAIEFGPLVSPLSFRHPAMLARYAAAVDNLSGGRLQLGLGAGWQQREHRNFSFDLMNVNERMDRFAEGVQIISHLLRNEQPLTFEGRYYQLYDAVVLPGPARSGGPPIVIGGNGPKRTLPLAARYADEWNAVFLQKDTFIARNDMLNEMIERTGRSPADVRRTMMTGCVYASSKIDLEATLEKRKRTLAEIQARGIIAGYGDGFVRRLEALRSAGVQRVMLQWIGLDDLNLLSEMADLVLPVFHGQDGQ